MENETDGMVTIKNAGWNWNIKSGESVTFGFILNEKFAGYPNEYLLLKFPDFLVKIAGKCTHLCLRICGDKTPNSYQVFHSFSTAYAMEFNEKNTNDNRGYYQSYAFIMKNPFSDMLMFSNGAKFRVYIQV